jgi:protein ImuA
MPPLSINEHWPSGMVWRASDAGHAACTATQSSGHADLDAVLPGQGWPVGGLIEVLQQQPVGADWQLVGPALIARQQQALREGHARWAGSVILINPVHPPFTPTWNDAGLDASRLVWLHPPQPQACAWVAVLAWLPHATATVLRRLQFMAAQSGCLLWVFRPGVCSSQASPAPLRLEVSVAASAIETPGLQVRVLKRRGLPWNATVFLPWLCSGLPQALQAQRQISARRRGATQEYRHEPTPLDGVGAAALVA